MTDKRTTTSAVEILHHLYFENDPKMMQMIEAERIKGDIAQRVYDLRETASLTQEQLAEKVGTTAKVIDDLEMTDYEDDSIGDAVLMLQRIAKATGKQIEFRIVPLKVESTQAELKTQPATVS
ncbi:MAG: helix-turn-helix transcriptional regulator [Gemmatimonadetes bacterium]|nr:helix-turn-helix transcriptional regulator [Gemmatimonadota bacterium]